MSRSTVVVLLCVVCCVTCVTQQGKLEIYTEDKLDYKFFPYSHKTIHFKVKARNDVNIGLTTEPSESDPMVEVVIGGWSNTNSVIRRRYRTIIEKVTAETPGILSASEYRGFWISWDGGVIDVGREGADEPFLSWKDPEPFTITHVGVHTGIGSTGSWIIEDPPATPVRRPTPPSCTPGDVESLCRDYCSSSDRILLPMYSTPATAFTNPVETSKTVVKRLTPRSANLN